VLQRQPEHAVAWSGIGRVLIEFARFAEARDACVRAIQADPTLAQAHVTLSTAFRALGEEEGAIEEELAARRLDPRAQPRTMTLEMDSPEAGASVPKGATAATAATAVPDYGLAADYLSKGLYDRAIAEVRRATARGAGDKEGMVLLARCFAARGDYEIAEKELSAALGTLPSDETVAVELASVHRAMGRPVDAVRRAVGLLRSNVYHFAALVVLGESLLDLKRTRDAARAFARVLKFDPDHALARKYSQLARLENG
jgi:tetratricopeptide (TPR) repeat protein